MSREEDKRFALVANATHNLVIITDKDRRVEWVNSAFTELTGYTLEEVKGMTPGAVLQGKESDPEKVKFMSEKLKAGEGFRDMEIINYKKSGEPYWISIEVQPVYDEGGELSQFIAIQTDITSTKHTQNALQESKRRLESLMSQSPIAVVEWDLDFRVKEWNNSAEKIFGYRREEALGQHASFILSEEVIPHVEDIWESLLNQQGGTRSRNTNVTKSGKLITCEWYNSPYSNQDNELNGVISMVEDVTQKVNYENRLVESEERFRKIINSSPMGIHVYEFTGDEIKLVQINPASCQILNLPEVINLSQEVIDSHEQYLSDDLRTILKDAAKNGTAWANENVVMNLDGVEKYLSINVFQAGENRAVSMCLDVTEQTLANQKTRQKNEELIRMNAELDRFVYSASHDLRAPIASMLGLIELYSMEENANKDLIDLQRKSLIRMDRFIKDIVDYSRNSRLELDVQPVNFDQEIQDSLDQINFMDNFSRIKISVNINQKEDFYSDIRRVRVILNNLISNGVKYADVMKSDPYLKIEIKSDARKAEIKVRDNGVGIKKESQDKIFEMFYRAHETGTGSGLGLYIVNEVVHKLFGEITLKSKYGEGSEFKVTIPNQIMPVQ